MAGALPGVVFLNWRDTGNPEGGGSEVYVEQVAAHLARRGHPVTLFCAAHGRAPRHEVTPDGVRIVRRGSRTSVYLHAAWRHVTGGFGRHGVVVDVQNGMPFLSRLYARRPVVVLVHHVHREQWRVVLGPVLARFGWWVESWLAPRVYRDCRYVTVSGVSRDELAGLGVSRPNITVVHNGTPPPLPWPVTRTAAPSLLVLGRLVPHKRIEVALLAAARLRDQFPDLQLVVAGRGWWEPRLRAAAAELGIGDRVRFAGYVDDVEKHRLLSSCWVSLVPSIKEGWGISVMESAVHGTPSVAFHDAGGLAESVLDGHTGLLARDIDEFVEHTRRLLVDAALRAQMGAAAVDHAGAFRWEQTCQRFAAVIDAVTGHHVAARDPVTRSSRST